MHEGYDIINDKAIFHPAYYLNEIREYYNMSKEEFAKILNIEKDKMLKLLNYEISIDDNIADGLEQYFDISKNYWLKLQYKYDIDKSKNIGITMLNETKVK